MPLFCFRFSTAHLAGAVIAVCLAVVLHGSPAAAQNKTLPGIGDWKVVTSKEAGVSALMPPGTIAANEGLPYDAKKGERLVAVIFDAPSTPDGSLLGIVVVRANQAGLAGVRAQALAEGASPKKTGIELLYDGMFQPLIKDALATVSDDPKKVFVTRKPLVWRGMKGEEIHIVKRANQNGAAAFTRLRVLKNETGIFLLSAIEKKSSPAILAHVNRFFDSFTIAPGDPFTPMPSKTK